MPPLTRVCAKRGIPHEHKERVSCTRTSWQLSRRGWRKHRDSRLRLAARPACLPDGPNSSKPCDEPLVLSSQNLIHNIYWLTLLVMYSKCDQLCGEMKENTRGPRHSAASHFDRYHDRHRAALRNSESHRDNAHARVSSQELRDIKTHRHV